VVAVGSRCASCETQSRVLTRTVGLVVDGTLDTLDTHLGILRGQANRPGQETRRPLNRMTASLDYPPIVFGFLGAPGIPVVNGPKVQQQSHFSHRQAASQESRCSPRTLWGGTLGAFCVSCRSVTTRSRACAARVLAHGYHRSQPSLNRSIVADCQIGLVH